MLKIDAFISHFLHIPFPDQLSDDEWSLAWAKVRFLANSGILGQQVQKMLE